MQGAVGPCGDQCHAGWHWSAHGKAHFFQPQAVIFKIGLYGAQGLLGFAVPELVCCQVNGPGRAGGAVQFAGCGFWHMVVGGLSGLGRARFVLIPAHERGEVERVCINANMDHVTGLVLGQYQFGVTIGTRDPEGRNNQFRCMAGPYLRLANDVHIRTRCLQVVHIGNLPPVQIQRGGGMCGLPRCFVPHGNANIRAPKVQIKANSAYVAGQLLVIHGKVRAASKVIPRGNACRQSRVGRYARGQVGFFRDRIRRKGAEVHVVCQVGGQAANNPVPGKGKPVRGHVQPKAGVGYIPPGNNIANGSMRDIGMALDGHVVNGYAADQRQAQAQMQVGRTARAGQAERMT